MQVFHGAVRLQGSLLNEVSKRGMTVPEIYILRRIHGGNDAVVRIEHAGDTELDDADERARLSAEYDDGLAALGDDQKTSVQKMFSEYGPLPHELKDYTGELVKRFAAFEEYQEFPLHSDLDEDDKIKGKKKKEKKAPVAGKAAKQLETIM